jgi:anti-sigma factor RsiW
VNRPLDERLSAYLDGELGERERDALESSLAHEPEGAQQLARLQALERSLRELPGLAPGSDFAVRFRARLERELRAARAPWWRRAFPMALGGFAAAAAAVVLALWLGRPEPLAPELEQVAEIPDPDTWELMRSGDVELLEVLEILEAWDAVQEG